MFQNLTISGFRFFLWCPLCNDTYNKLDFCGVILDYAAPFRFCRKFVFQNFRIWLIGVKIFEFLGYLVIR